MAKKGSSRKTRKTIAIVDLEPPETVRAIIAIQTDPGVKIILLEPQSLKFIGY